MTPLQWREIAERPNVCALSVAADYVISHRPARYMVSFRPPGKHVHVGLSDTLVGAQTLAQSHHDNANHFRSP
jgi:hypothetical protein